MRATLIRNPTAGKDEQPSQDELLRFIRKAGHDDVYQYVFLSTPYHLIPAKALPTPTQSPDRHFL